MFIDSFPVKPQAKQCYQGTCWAYLPKTVTTGHVSIVCKRYNKIMRSRFRIREQKHLGYTLWRSVEPAQDFWSRERHAHFITSTCTSTLVTCEGQSVLTYSLVQVTVVVVCLFYIRYSHINDCRLEALLEVPSEWYLYLYQSLCNRHREIRVCWAVS